MIFAQLRAEGVMPHTMGPFVQGFEKRMLQRIAPRDHGQFVFRRLEANLAVFFDGKISPSPPGRRISNGSPPT